MPVEIGLQHIAGEREANAQIVAIVVVRNVMPHQMRGTALVGMFLVLHVDVHHAVVAVNFDNGVMSTMASRRIF